MKRIDIDQKWEMRIVGDTEDTGFIPATVPGSVYNDLLESGRIEDPYYRDNENAALELMKNDICPFHGIMRGRGVAHSIHER